jgi:hypothetical protein
MDQATPLRQRDLFRFWLPLASTWMMMAIEGPFLAAMIARLAEPVYNLAAHGVAFAVAIILEAPVIMMLGAATALVDGRVSFLRLRRFTAALNIGTTVAMVGLVATPVFPQIFEGWVGLDPKVADLTRGALWILLPWPAAIGYRRFHQGLLIRRGEPRKVAYGTTVRLAAMSVTAFGLFLTTEIPGTWVAAAALSAGVCVEAVAARFMARGEVRRLTAADAVAGTPTTYGDIWRFYVPLAWTSVVALAAHPMVTFFMGQAPNSLESLAVLPVITSLAFLFRSLGLAYQEVAITMLDRDPNNRRAVFRFAATLGVTASLGFALIVATPLAGPWFRGLSGLSEELFRFAQLPAWILIPIPGLSVLLSLQRAWLMHQRATRPITWATIAEIAGIATILALMIFHFGSVGAVAAAVAFVGGRLAANLILAVTQSRGA